MNCHLRVSYAYLPHASLRIIADPFRTVLAAGPKPLQGQCFGCRVSPASHVCLFPAKTVSLDSRLVSIATQEHRGRVRLLCSNNPQNFYFNIQGAIVTFSRRGRAASRWPVPRSPAPLPHGGCMYNGMNGTSVGDDGESVQSMGLSPGGYLLHGYPSSPQASPDPTCRYECTSG